MVTSFVLADSSCETRDESDDYKIKHSCQDQPLSMTVISPTYYYPSLIDMLLFGIKMYIHLSRSLFLFFKLLCECHC